MVVVRIELWPEGDPKKARLLGVATLTNDGTGDTKYGNYDVKLSHAGKFLAKRTGTWKTGRVEHHRKSKSPYHLVFKALKSCLFPGRK